MSDQANFDDTIQRIIAAASNGEVHITPEKYEHIKRIINHNLSQTLQEIRKEIEGMKRLYGTEAAKRVGSWAELCREHNNALDQVLQVIDKHLTSSTSTLE